MPAAPTRWIKRLAEFRPKEETSLVPRGTRGIYALFHKAPKNCYDVVYIGLSRRGIRGRLESHGRSRMKASEWSHFSLFEVWDNVSDAEISELEGLFRHIYRHDTKANRLNAQKTHGPLKKVRVNDLAAWNQG